MHPTTHTLETPHVALLDRLVQRMADDGRADAVTRRAVDVLTSAAAPDRADRLAIRPGESPALVERLAVWALERAPRTAVDDAHVVLDGRDVVPATIVPATDRDLVAC